MENLDDAFISDIQVMIDRNESIELAFEDYNLQEYADEWEWVKQQKDLPLPESWHKALNGESHDQNEEDKDEDEVSEYEATSSSSDDDEEYDDVVDDVVDDDAKLPAKGEEWEEYEREDDELPGGNTEEKETFKKGLNIFKSVTGIATFYPLFIHAMRDGDCSSALERQYLDRGQYIPYEFINILMFYMANALSRRLSDDLWLHILGCLHGGAKKLYADVLKPYVGKDDEGESKWMMFRRGVIFYTTFRKDDNIYLSGYQLDSHGKIHSRSVYFKYNFGIPNDIIDTSGLKQEMLQNDWTKLMPRCDEAVKDVLWSMPHVAQLIIMMIMFGELDDDKAMKLLRSLQTSRIPTMTFLALVGHLLHEHCYRELKQRIPRGRRQRTIDIQFGPKKRKQRDQIRVVLQLDRKKVGFNMWQEHENVSMKFNDIMRIMRKDMLSLKVMSKIELDNLFPWENDAFDWSSFKFGFYNRCCDYSRYNPLEVSLKKGDGLWLTIVEVPKANLLLRNYRGWGGPCELDLPRHPQESSVREIVPVRFHPGLTEALLNLPMYELGKRGGMFFLDFPKKELRCYVDGIREEVTPLHFENSMRKLALDTLKSFHADGKTVYFCSSMDYRIRCTLVILRMYLQKDSALARKSDKYQVNRILGTLFSEYKGNVTGKNVYDVVRVFRVPESPYLEEKLPELNNMIQEQTAEGNDVVGTPLQFMAYQVFSTFYQNNTIGYCDTYYNTPTFAGADYRFYTLPKYEGIPLVRKNKLNRIGFQFENVEKKVNLKDGQIVTLALVDGKPYVNGKSVSSWEQFLRCLRFLKFELDVPVIRGIVCNKDYLQKYFNYLQKPFDRVYWLHSDQNIMVKTMALNTFSKLLRKRPRYLKAWRSKVVVSITRIQALVRGWLIRLSARRTKDLLE